MFSNLKFSNLGHTKIREKKIVHFGELSGGIVIKTALFLRASKGCSANLGWFCRYQDQMRYEFFENLSNWDTSNKGWKHEKNKTYHRIIMSLVQVTSYNYKYDIRREGPMGEMMWVPPISTPESYHESIWVNLQSSYIIYTYYIFEINEKCVKPIGVITPVTR